MGADRAVRCRSGRHLSSDVDWTAISSGEVLRKFTAVDESNGKDYTVEIHGFFDEQGKLYILETVVKPSEEPKP